MNKQLALDIRLKDEATFGNYIGIAEQQLNCAESWRLIWGKKGSGKSHLLQACCHDNPSSIYLAALDSLAPEVLFNLEQFELICLDDIDLILHDDAWQEALFHLLNAAKDNGNHVLMSARLPANELSVTLKDLHSRMISAVAIETDQLSDEQKLSVLMLRANNRGFTVSEEVGKYILSRSARNMPDILALLDQLELETLRQGKRVTIPFVKQVLGF